MQAADHLPISPESIICIPKDFGRFIECLQDNIAVQCLRGDRERKGSLALPDGVGIV